MKFILFSTFIYFKKLKKNISKQTTINHSVIHLSHSHITLSSHALNSIKMSSRNQNSTELKKLKKELMGNINIEKIKQESQKNALEFNICKLKNHTIKKTNEMEEMKKQLFGNKYQDCPNDLDIIGFSFQCKMKLDFEKKMEQEKLKKQEKELKEILKEILKEQEEKSKNPRDVLFFEQPPITDQKSWEQELEVREIVKKLKEKKEKPKQDEIKQDELQQDEIQQDEIKQDEIKHEIQQDEIQEFHENIWSKFDNVKIKTKYENVKKSNSNSNSNIFLFEINEKIEMQNNFEKEQIMELMKNQ
jgi:aspartate beta-hydroxylase